MRLSKKWLCHFFEKESLRSVPLLSAASGQQRRRNVFSAAHLSRQKTNRTAFAPADAKLCEAFFDKLFCSSGK